MPVAERDEVYLLAEHLLSSGLVGLPEREKRVIERCARRLAVTRPVHREFANSLTFGERLADKVAELGGSWKFIIAFAGFLVSWTITNIWILTRPFDPYPFIFLNLMLSMLAAIQAPIIMMSQNRAAAHDRMRAEQDYEVNLKAEIEIMALHEKLDRMRTEELAELIKSVTPPAR
ncbi:hypothetical protein HY78_07665 [Rhizorhabdus wittichii DC-6]|nr:hypothetical protein HY78_07665 [Rhizorhabdus wittichii DC-6]